MHLQNSIANLTNQLDNAERQLEEERAARKDLEESRELRLKEVENQWKAVIEEKKDNWESRERSLEEKVESQDRLLNELKASYEVAQRLGQTGENETEGRQSSVSAAELEIISSDLDRTSQRLAEVEARNEQLRVELAEASSNNHRKQNDEDPAIARLRSENSSLMRKLEASRRERDSELRNKETRIRNLEKDTKSLQQDREELRARVRSWRDYPDLKRELEIFKVCLPLAKQIPSFLIDGCSLSNFPPLTMMRQVNPQTLMVTMKVMSLLEVTGLPKMAKRRLLSNYCSLEIRS